MVSKQLQFFNDCYFSKINSDHCVKVLYTKKDKFEPKMRMFSVKFYPSPKKVNGWQRNGFGKEVELARERCVANSANISSFYTSDFHPQLQYSTNVELLNQSIYCHSVSV